jgi:hypothetical protein
MPASFIQVMYIKHKSLFITGKSFLKNQTNVKMVSLLQGEMITQPAFIVVFLLRTGSFETVPGRNMPNGTQNVFMLFTSKALNSF